MRVEDGSTASTATRCPLWMASMPRRSIKVLLPAPGNACDAEPLSDSVWAVGSTKKFFVAGLVLGQRAFHPGDGLSEGIAFAGQHSRGKRFSRP